MTISNRNVAPPNLPIAPANYSHLWQNQFSNVLRLYFNKLSSVLYNPTGSTTYPNALGYCATFYNSANSPTSVANTAMLVTMDTTVLANGFALVANSKITAKYAGVYQVDFVGQFANSSGSNVQVTFWLAKNGANVPGTAQEVQFTGGAGGISNASWVYLQNLAAGDYLQFYWSTTVNTVTLAAQAAATGPTRPSSPSFTVNITQV